MGEITDAGVSGDVRNEGRDVREEESKEFWVERTKKAGRNGRKRKAKLEEGRRQGLLLVQNPLSTSL